MLAGTAGRSTEEAVGWTKFAKETGVDGAMVIPPYYNPPTEDELCGYYLDIAEAVDLPIMPYNNPTTSGVDMSPEFIHRLHSTIDSISCVKEASGDARRVQSMLSLIGDDLVVFWGEETAISAALALGARGWISGSANIIPEKCSRLFDLLVGNGNLAGAWRIHRQLFPLLVECESKKWLTIIKAGIDLRGEIRAGAPRKPMLPLGTEERERLRSMVERALEA